MANMRRRLLENQSLPEDKKYETTFSLFSYGSSQILLEVSQRKRGESNPETQSKSVVKPRHSGVMLLSPGKFIITNCLFFCWVVKEY